MMYKTIVLGLLQERPLVYEHLITNRSLLSALETHAKELKARHEAWQDRLWLAKPMSDPSQIASEALEIALNELENRLLSDSAPNKTAPLSLDAAMAFIRPTPPA